ncbi:hypothetical protein ACIPY0_21135 [Paenarthrobacter nicotinovorans]|uniref:hypothetical protein n=1 Tax=Paenarthrobacter nicotinovorans TaxID=29320 RepID=UPI003811A86B
MTSLESILRAAPKDIREMALDNGAKDPIRHALFVLGNWSIETRNPEAPRLSKLVAALRDQSNSHS